MKAFVDTIRAIVGNASAWYILVGAAFILMSRYNGKLEDDLKKANSSIYQKDIMIKDLKSKINNYLLVNGEFEKPAKNALPVLKKFDLIQDKL